MADDAIGVPELSASGTASSSTFLRGDNTWAAAGGGKVIGFQYDNDGTHRNFSGSWADCGMSITYTPQSSSSKIELRANLNMFASCVQSSGATTWGNGYIRILCDNNVINEQWKYVVGLGHSGYYSHYATWKSWQFNFSVVYSNGSTSAKTFKPQMYENSGVLELNKEQGTSYFSLYEYKN